MSENQAKDDLYKCLIILSKDDVDRRNYYKFFLSSTLKDWIKCDEIPVKSSPEEIQKEWFKFQDRFNKHFN